MTDRPTEFDQMEIDPYADDDGRIGVSFDAEVGLHVAALLGDAVSWLEPSDDLGDAVVARIEAEMSEAATAAAPLDAEEGVAPVSRRRTATPAIIGVAAGLMLLFVGILALSAISGAPEAPAVAIDLVPTGEILDVEGSIEITETSSGLRVDLDAASLPRRASGDFYEGWLRLDDGRVVPIGTFNEGADVTLWAGVDLERVDELTISLGTAADASAPGASGRVVFKVDLP